jgi:hypothetical protein
MCSENAKVLVEMGIENEGRDPNLAAKQYLEAASILMVQSKKHPKREKEYVEVAGKLYNKAKSLPTNAVLAFKSKSSKIMFSDIAGLED